MDAVTRSIVQAGMDASNYVAGARQVEQANKGIAGSSDQVVASQQRAEQTTARGGRAFERLRSELDRTYAAQQRFERAQLAVNRAQERGLVSGGEAARLVELARERYLGLAAANDNASRGIGSFVNASALGAAALGLLSSALAAVSVGGFLTLTRNAIDTVGGLGELADAAGVSTDALQALQFAAVGAGLKSEEMQRGLEALTRRVGDAQNGSERAQFAFRTLGIAFQETSGAARSTEAVLADIADRIQAYENPTDRARIATEFFGDRLGQRLIPLLINGREGLEGLIQRSIEFGVVADADLIAKADQASDKVAELSAQFTALANNLLARVAPALSAFADILNRSLTGPSATQRGAALSEQIVAAGREIAALEQRLAGVSPRDGLVRPNLEARIAALRDLQSGLIEQSRQLATTYEGQQQRASGVLAPPARPAATLPPLQPSTGGAARATGGRMASAARVADPLADADARSRAATTSLRQEIELLEAQGRLLTASVEIRERELAALRARQQIIGRNGDPESEASRAYIEAAQAAASARIEQQRMASGLQEVQRIGEQAFNRIGEAITQAFLSGESAAVSWGNVAKAIVSEVAQALVRLAVINPIMNAVFGTSQNTLGSVLSALGGAAGGAMSGVNANWASSAAAVGPHLAFADGGVVTRPTVFGMAGGTGLMGEAGPEAILPLRRGADGKLGVAAAGGGAAINQTINVNVSGGSPGMGGNVSPDQARIIAAEVQKAARAAAEDAIRNNMRLGGMLNPSSGRAA